MTAFPTRCLAQVLRAWIVSLAASIGCPGAVYRSAAQSDAFWLPTENQFLFAQGAEPLFFAPTPGRPWTSGTFGCVRSEGWQFHEGLDILHRNRDARGEPTDWVWATATGTVAYVNHKAPLSNYGKYLVLRHFIDGLEVYSTYAHLQEIHPNIQPGQPVYARQPLGVLGRTSNTAQPISKDRAHLHFEINLLLQDHFSQWHRLRYPTGRNDHGDWNGQAFIGLDPWRLFQAQRQEGTNFNLPRWIRDETELCRVWIRATNLSWAARYPALIRPNSKTLSEPMIGYEVALNFAGLPFELTPRTASEIHLPGQFHLLSVNAPEQKLNPCRKLLIWDGRRWRLTHRALELLDLLVFCP